MCHIEPDAIKEYIRFNIFYTFIGMIWYQYTLFKKVAGLSLMESRVLLWIMVALALFLGIYVGIRSGCLSGASMFANVVTPFGLYCAISYFSINTKLIIGILVGATSLSALYVFLVFIRKIKCRHRKKKIIKRRIQKAFAGCRIIFSGSFTVIILYIGSNLLFGSSVVQASVEAKNYTSGSEHSMEVSLETLLCLQPERWDDLTVQDRVDVLQTIANIEAWYLGIPNELNIGVRNLPEGTSGYYRDSTHEIVISTDHLLYGDVEELLDTVCHEAYHCYEHRLVEVYGGAEERLKSLRIFKNTDSYMQEFNNYINGKEDYSAYYSQICEQDAREYAENAVAEYYEYIDAVISNEISVDDLCKESPYAEGK